MQNFRMLIKLLAKSMTNHNNHQVVVTTNINDRSVEARVCDFVWMNPPMFLRLHVGKDP